MEFSIYHLFNAKQNAKPDGTGHKLHIKYHHHWPTIPRVVVVVVVIYTSQHIIMKKRYMYENTIRKLCFQVVNQ
jgi:hypothetical protein